MLTDLKGQKFGRLTVLSRNNQICHPVHWNCLCSCGKVKVVAGADLKRGKVKSCGCWHREESAARAATQFTKHSGTGTRLYRIWKSMRTRCRNPNSKAYKQYGGRGVTICSEWDDFILFRNWALSNGYQENLTIDRIDVNGNYCPENCRWATWGEQGVNKRTSVIITIGGVSRPLKEWSILSGINYGTLKDRFRAGWREEKLLLPTKK